MTIFGAIALVVLVILGIAVLRIKSDPKEKDSIRSYLAEFKTARDMPDPQRKKDPPVKS